MQISHTKTIFISFATIRKPSNADVFIKARGKILQKLRGEIVSHYPTPSAVPEKAGASSESPFLLFPFSSLCPSSRLLSAKPQTYITDKPAEILLIIDTLNPLATTQPHHLTAFLTSLLTHPTISLIATYHTDIPIPPLPATPHNHQPQEHVPSPLAILHHLATAVLRASSLPHTIARRRAEHRSLQAPSFGLDEGREGVLVGLTSRGKDDAAVVVEMELRRRSGRAVVERFVLSPAEEGGSGRGSGPAAVAGVGTLSLLSDHPAFAAPEDDVLAGGVQGGLEEESAETTFSLGLTEKQRRDREGIVLPYFDAQQDVGGGEGGRILYDMGREDDFDDEEDEI